MLPSTEHDVDAKGRVMLLLRALRDPLRKAPVNAQLDERQLDVARRLDAVLPGDKQLQRLLKEADQSVRGH